MIDTPIRVQRVDVERVRDVRHVVLRPGQPRPTTVYVEDSRTDAFHLGAFQSDDIVGVTSIYRESPPESVRSSIDRVHTSDGWRIRGMATMPSVRGTGVGRQLLDVAVDHMMSTAKLAVWCNARETAFGFYERCGFRCVGARFDLPGIGEHSVMIRVPSAP